MERCITVFQKIKTPADLTSEKNIKNIFRLIEKSFKNVRSKKIEIIKELQREDTNSVNAVMGTINTENESLITIAVKNNFSKVKQLKDIFQENQLEFLKLAEYFAMKEEYDRAFELYKNVLERRKNILGPNNPATFEIQIDMYKLLYKQHKYSEVLPLLREILQKQNNILGEDHEQSLYTKSFIAMVLHRLGKNHEAIQIYEDFYPKQMKVVKQKNLDDSELTNTQIGMSLVLDALDRRDEAIDLTRQVYENHKKKLGANHPQTLVAQNNIAMFLKNQGKYEKALEMFECVYEKRKKVLGDNHSDTLRVLSHIASIYNLQGNAEKSSNAYQNLAKIQERYLDPHHLDALKTKELLAELYIKEGKHIQAMQMMNENIDPLESILGSDHEYVSRAKSCINFMNQSLKYSGQSRISSLLSNPENLRKAVITKKAQTLRHLLENLKSDVNTKYENDQTLLHFAADVGNAEIVNILLGNGASITSVTKKGNTPLHIAALKNSKDVVEILLKQAKQCQLNNFVNAKTLGSGSTALHVAAKSGYFEIVVAMLKCNAIYEIKDNESRSPQTIAKNSKIISLLKLIDQLFEIVKSGNETTFEELKFGSEKSLEAILNARNCDNKSAAQTALLNKRKVMASKLLSMLKQFDS